MSCICANNLQRKSITLMVWLRHKEILSLWSQCRVSHCYIFVLYIWQCGKKYFDRGMWRFWLFTFWSMTGYLPEDNTWTRWLKWHTIHCSASQFWIREMVQATDQNIPQHHVKQGLGWTTGSDHRTRWKNNISLKTKQKNSKSKRLSKGGWQNSVNNNSNSLSH